MSAKLNVRHDYITLKVIFAPKNNINLTVSRNGVSTSGCYDGQAQAIKAMDLFDNAYKAFKGKAGDFMEEMKNKLENAKDVNEVMKLLEKAA